MPEPSPDRVAPVRTARLLAVLVLAVESVAGQPVEAPARRLSAEEIKGRERMVLLSVSTVLLAEKNYAAANGSFFGEMRCLTHPAECLPGGDANAAPFLDPSYEWLETKLGYVRKLHAGPRATEEQIRRARASPTSLVSYAFTATPENPESGGRAFCGDSAGRMCFTPDGREPPVREGRCEPCKKLQ